MRILVTGGAGFIGSHLTEKLVLDGNDVVVLDDFSLGSPDNLAPVQGNVEIVRGSLLDRDLVNKLTGGADVVFNEAAASSSPMFIKNLNYAASVNVEGFINVLNACRDCGVGKLVYASSSSVYGNAKPPMREDAHTPPVNFYASTKLFNEHYASLFSKEYGLETIGLRYMSVYGPREHSKGVFANLVSQFLWAMQKDEPPVIYGDGTQTRDFTFVSDIVQANILAMNSGFSSEVFNVGTGRCVSLNELVSIINRLLGKSIEPRYIENKVKNYIAAQIGDITKARRMLGYSPRYDLETGISEILASEQAA